MLRCNAGVAAPSPDLVTVVDDTAELRGTASVELSPLDILLLVILGAGLVWLGRRYL